MGLSSAQDPIGRGSISVPTYKAYGKLQFLPHMPHLATSPALQLTSNASMLANAELANREGGMR